MNHAAGKLIDAAFVERYLPLLDELPRQFAGVSYHFVTEEECERIARQKPPMACVSTGPRFYRVRILRLRRASCVHARGSLGASKPCQLTSSCRLQLVCVA